MLIKTHAVSNPRFDGQFNIGAGCTLNVNAMFGCGGNHVDGTANIYNEYAPQVASDSLTFGVNGVINFMDGSRNGVEGNNRTTTISASLLTGTVTLSSQYGIEKRYLMAAANGTGFSTGLWQTWNLANGTITSADNNGLVMSKAEGNLVANADTFGQYKLGTDGGGVFIEYVVATPEPTTASLSLLGLAALLLHRRRN